LFIVVTAYDAFAYDNKSEKRLSQW